MVYKSDKTRCNLTGSAISRERLRVVRVNATVARRYVGGVPLWRSLAQLSAVPEISRSQKCNHARARTAQARARATERTIGRRPARTSTTVRWPERLVGACTVLRAPTLGAGTAGEPVLVRAEALCAKLSDFVRTRCRFSLPTADNSALERYTSLLGWTITPHSGLLGCQSHR